MNILYPLSWLVWKIVSPVAVKEIRALVLDKNPKKRIPGSTTCKTCGARHHPDKNCPRCSNGT